MTAPNRRKRVFAAATVKIPPDSGGELLESNVAFANPLGATLLHTFFIR
jgi:hypothetical protein